MSSRVHPIKWENRSLLLLDQRLLPHQIRYQPCRSPEEVASAIREMLVRGAPAIGVCAAFGMVLALESAHTLDEAMKALEKAATALGESRPTAVNLRWAIDRMLSRSHTTPVGDVAGLRAILTEEAERIFSEDLAGNRRIGRFGQELLPASSTILTHCNAGALATSGYGTALGVVRAAAEAGKKIAVFADETRPYLQGARLTTWELQQDGIDVTLITDSMAGSFFRQGQFDAVLVGADRIAANGDTANKIGTYTLAVLANAHGVPFYVAAPLSTIDPSCPTGAEIPIEERAPAEVTRTTGRTSDGSIVTVSTAPDDVAVRHPAFDVTPKDLITAIITERGVLRPPFGESIRRIFSKPSSE